MYGSVTALADNAAELIFVEYADHLWTSEFLLFLSLESKTTLFPSFRGM